jgi:hypothetical protein
MEYKFFKRADSEMSALVFGKYRAASLAGYLGPMEDQTLFFATSEARRIKNEFISLARPRSAVSKIFSGRVPLAIEIVAPGVHKLDDWESRSQIRRSAVAGSKRQSPRLIFVFEPIPSHSGMEPGWSARRR